LFWAATNHAHEEGAVELDILGDIKEEDTLDDGYGDNNRMDDDADNDASAKDEDVTLMQLNPEFKHTEVTKDDDTVNAVKLNYGVVLQLYQELYHAIGNNQRYLASAFQCTPYAVTCSRWQTYQCKVQFGTRGSFY
jgi:hypothetical protein